MPQFFIDRPVFAWVVAILITLGGLISLTNLGVQSYPTIAPPQVNVIANYPGADSGTTESSVTEVIEQQLTGIDNLAYFNSTTSSNGRVQITLTFEAGTNPDIAAVQVQNQVERAKSRLPQTVVQQGVFVVKSNPGFLMAVGLRSDTPDIDRDRLNDIIASQVLDQISRIPGVGDTRHFGSEYALRVWLNPDKLRGYGLSATEAIQAIEAQNIQVAAGSLGSDPAVDGWGFTANVVGEKRLSTPDQFKKIILRANNDGTTVTLGDVSRIELGPETYGFDIKFNGKAVGAFGIQLLSGANALEVSKAVRSELEELQSTFPQGVSWFVPYDSTTFITTSIDEVIHTLIEAIILVFLVMLLFLQNIRATVIPAIVIPIALLGTFMGMAALGFTINQLTLFGMVLAIGIVVDDAIVVVENVERLMTEEGLSAKQATRRGMREITGAIVAITAVLAAVFIPSALQPGSAGIVYQQFALTIAVSMVFSAILALSFTPALCASMLKPVHNDNKNIFYRKFNEYFGWVQKTYVGHVAHAVRHAPKWMVVFAVVVALAGFLYAKLPGSFLPEEDQGYVMTMVQLPPGATKQRTQVALAEMAAVAHDDPAVESVFNIAGFSFVGLSEGNGMAFIKLKDWSEREETAQDVIDRLNVEFARRIRDAQIFVVNLPTVQGLGQFGGFDMYLESRGGSERSVLDEATAQLLAKAADNPVLVGVRPNQLPPAPELDFKVDRVKAASMGLSVMDVSQAVSLMLAPVYVNDFFTNGRVKRVMVQADAPFRQNEAAFDQFYSPSSTQTEADGLPAMIPVGSVLDTHWSIASPTLARYNGYPAVEIVGSAAPGYASGEAMKAIEKIITDELPHGMSFDWTGQSFEEVASGNAATMLMLFSILVVFLVLAALYESWSIPLAVLLIVPLALLGAVAFTMGRGLSNDIYFKIGLITVIGLAAKNAILIVEYAIAEQLEGRTLREAVVDAARLRFRPILMTSMAFLLGVFPLFISTGAGANARHAIGTGVIGGMLFATFFGLLLIPVFYVIVRYLVGDRLDKRLKQDKEDA